jgi:predicted XRE-type DNA-binding protein
MISNEDKKEYMYILTQLNEENVNFYTQQQIADNLGISLRKVNSFINGKIIDFWLLTQYAAMLGRKIVFFLN